MLPILGPEDLPVLFVLSEGAGEGDGLGQTLGSVVGGDALAPAGPGLGLGDRPTGAFADELTDC